MSGFSEAFPAGSHVQVAGRRGWQQVIRWEMGGETFHYRAAGGRGHVSRAHGDDVTAVQRAWEGMPQAPHQPAFGE
jgi:hypothetical protein